uniref:J domain-containing protein n=1 Tax=Kalanchoe fedtschenkoi TaxID=63787 RepID=A0A7N0UFY9_KALFE
MNHLALGSTASLKTAPLVSGFGTSGKPVRLVAAISCRASSVATESNKSFQSNLYDVLSISSPENTQAEDIKRAYRAMALRYHPDVCRDPYLKEESARMFVSLHEAYRILSDPVLRSEYDLELGLSRKRENDDFRKRVWRDQLSELRRRSSSCGLAEKEGSWGSRMREQNRKRN